MVVNAVPWWSRWDRSDIPVAIGGALIGIWGGALFTLWLYWMVKDEIPLDPDMLRRAFLFFGAFMALQTLLGGAFTGVMARHALQDSTEARPSGWTAAGFGCAAGAFSGALIGLLVWGGLLLATGVIREPGALESLLFGIGLDAVLCGLSGIPIGLLSRRQILRETPVEGGV